MEPIEPGSRWTGPTPCVSLREAVLVPTLDDARVAVALGGAVGIYLIACREDVCLELVAHLEAFDGSKAHFFEDLAGGNARLLELPEVGLVEDVLALLFVLDLIEAELEGAVAVRFDRLDLNDGAGARFHDGDGDHLAVFREDLRHADLAADDCFIHG